MNCATVAFEAAYLRTALLVGLVHEREVPAWAEHVLTHCPAMAGLAADVLTCPVELTAMREQLRPLSAAADDQGVQRALLTTIRIELPWRGVRESLRVLEHMRHECGLVDIADTVKALHDRGMLASVGVPGETDPSEHDLLEALGDAAPSGFFTLQFDDVSEAQAFVAALSRVMARDRVWSGQSCFAWLHHDTRSYDVVLDEAAWQCAVRHFSPLPSRSCIPQPVVPTGAKAVLDSETTPALGASDAALLLSVTHRV